MQNAVLDVPADKADLLRDGYCVVRGAMPASIIAQIAQDLGAGFDDTPLSQGLFYGSDTRRFGGLLTRSLSVAACVQNPVIMEMVQAVLSPWCEHVSLNLTQAIELMPGARAQVPHRDQDMWPCSTMFREGLGAELLVNVMWPLAPFTRENGATRIWAGSHRRLEELIMDPAGAVIAEMEPGDALLFLGSTLHAGGANQTGQSRRGMIISYALGWLKPYELQWLTYPPSVAREFAPELAALVGYRIHRPNLGNVEGQCPSNLLRNDGLPRGAIDALRPDQISLIERYLEESRERNMSPKAS